MGKKHPTKTTPAARAAAEAARRASAARHLAASQAAPAAPARVRERPDDATLLSWYAARIIRESQDVQDAQAASVQRMTDRYGADAVHRGQAAREWWDTLKPDRDEKPRPIPEDFLTALDLDSPVDAPLLADLLWDRDYYVNELHDCQDAGDEYVYYERWGVVSHWFILTAPEGTAAAGAGFGGYAFCLYAPTREDLAAQVAALEAVGLTVVPATDEELKGRQAQVREQADQAHRQAQAAALATMSGIQRALNPHLL